MWLQIYESNFLIKPHQYIKLKEITHREILDHREDSYGINQTLEYDSDNIDGVKIYEQFYNTLKLIYKIIISGL